MNKSRLVSGVMIFFAVAASAFANDFMFSHATAPIVMLAMMAWLVAGVVVKLCCKGFIYGGLGWIIMAGLCIWLMDGHVELALILWMIYLPLIVVYSASHIGKRRGAWVNFIFHGIFLAMIIVGGILAKIELWSKAGGWTAWSARMREGYLPWFLVFLTLALIASLGIKKEHEEE